MSNLASRHEVIKAQYNFSEWKPSTLTLEALRGIPTRHFPQVIAPAPFELQKRLILPDDQPGFYGIIDLYRSAENPTVSFSVTILQNQTIEQAHEHLIDELSKSTAPSLPRAETKGIFVGHISFAGNGETQTSVRFVRRNLFVKVESVGSKPAGVKEMAEEIDRQIIAQFAADG